jgi:hypothetical protein
VNHRGKKLMDKSACTGLIPKAGFYAHSVTRVLDSESNKTVIGRIVLSISTSGVDG